MNKRITASRIIPGFFSSTAAFCIMLCLILTQGCNIEITPVVTTGEVSAITNTTATCGGTVSNNGASVTVRGVCYNTTGRPNINDPHTTDGSGSGDFRSYLTGLQSNTTYYVRAYAGNGDGISYGDEVSFTTTNGGENPGNPDVPFTITTQEVTDITYNSARCSVIFTGNTENITEYGVSYNTTGSPNTNDYHGIPDGGYNFNLANLQPNTTYYVRAYAISNNYVTYGNEISFTTSSTTPTTLLTIPRGWVLSAATSTPAYVMANGTTITDLMSDYLYDFELDDIIIFSPNGTHRVLPGLLYNSEFGYTTETNLGQWYFDNPNNPTYLHMQIPFFYGENDHTCSPELEVCRIISLTTDMLKIAYTFNDDEPVKTTYTFTLTYVPAN